MLEAYGAFSNGSFIVKKPVSQSSFCAALAAYPAIALCGELSSVPRRDCWFIHSKPGVV